MQLCRGFTDDQWKKLRLRLQEPNGNLSDDETAWACAINVFERRIRERFITSIEALEHYDSCADVEVPPNAPGDCSLLPDDIGVTIIVPGFAIMALCCLLIETLQSFREKPSGTNDAFTTFLSRRPAFAAGFSDDHIARSFANGVRNGILHDAETRRWAIWRDEPPGRLVVRKGAGYAVNRNAFFLAVKKEFESYVAELRGPNRPDLRKRFLEKINKVVDKC